MKQILGQVSPADTDPAILVDAKDGVEIEAIYICNYEIAGKTFSIFADQIGGSAAHGNAIYYEQSISAAATTVVDTPIYLKSGVVFVQASVADSLTFTAVGERHAKSK